MSQPVEYPGEAPTGPHTAVLPEVPHQPVPHGYAYPPMPQAPPPPSPGGSSRLNKVAAWVGIVAGSLIIIALLFGSGFYLGRETAPRPVDRSATGPEQGGPMIFPMPRGEFERPGPGIVVPNVIPNVIPNEIPNGPTFQLPNIFPQFPMSPQPPTTRAPGEPPR